MILIWMMMNSQWQWEGEEGDLLLLQDPLEAGEEEVVVGDYLLDHLCHNDPEALPRSRHPQEVQARRILLRLLLQEGTKKYKIWKGKEKKKGEKLSTHQAVEKN